MLVKEGATSSCPHLLCSFRGKAAPTACELRAILQDCIPLSGGGPSLPYTGSQGGELGWGFVSQPGRSPGLFHAQRSARVCTTASGITCSLGIKEYLLLKCRICLVCKYLPAKCTRKGSPALLCSKALGSLQCKPWHGSAGVVLLSPGERKLMLKALGMLAWLVRLGMGATRDRNCKDLYFFW